VSIDIPCLLSWLFGKTKVTSNRNPKKTETRFQLHMESNDDKEEQIKKMLDQKKSWKTIMQELHVGPNTIKKVKDANTPVARTKRSEAFEMFERKSSHYEVSLKLDISSDEVKKHQMEYLELKAQDELIRFLNDKDISNLVPIAREMKTRGLTPEQTETGLKLLSSVRQLELERAELSDSIRIDRNKYLRLSEEKSMVENQLDKLIKQKGRLLEDIDFLESRYNFYQLAIERIRNSKELTNVQQIVHDTTRSILEDKKILLCASAVAIIRAISTEPQSITLFSDPTATEKLASFFLDPGPPGNEIWIYRVAKSIFENYVDFLAKGIVGCTINTLGDSKYETLTEQVSAEIGQLMTLHKHSPFLRSLFRN
jgi:hypothetical protein